MTDTAKPPTKHITSKGYVRLSSGPKRMRYEHRAVLEGLKNEQRRHAVAMLIGVNPEMAEWMIPWLVEQESKDDRLPLDDEVHHIDFTRTHNCPGNMLLVDARMHAAWSAGRRAVDAGRYKQRNQWSRRLPGMEVEDGKDDEVPF